MQPVVYRSRRSAVSRSERAWRVDEDALVVCAASGRERRVVWADVVSVRLCREPARGRPWRHVFELQPRHGRKIELDNAHYAGAAGFEDRSATYAPFVRAALARVAAESPKARALIGETPTRYFLLLIGALVVLGGLAFALVAVPTPLDSLPFAALVKLGLILLMVPIFGRWVLGAMPRGVPLDAIPERALPPES
jgi:hypothetical protein